MAGSSRAQLVEALLERYPRTYGEELGISSPRGPTAQFCLLLMSLLMGARIRSSVALKACRALIRDGLKTPQAMASASFEERSAILNGAGYARYDESTSRMLGRTSTQLLDNYHGDLRKLRAKAHEDPVEERRLLSEFPGVGEVSVDIFFREIQCVWGELYPFVDAKTLAAARRIGLCEDPGELVELVEADDFARVVSALVRMSLDNSYEEVRARAHERAVSSAST